MEYFCSFLRIFATKVRFLVEITKFFANKLQLPTKKKRSDFPKPLRLFTLTNIYTVLRQK